MPSAPAIGAEDADLERRFGGLRRLYGAQAYARLRSLRIGVVGLGGVGSWVAEALARSGVAALTLIDMDHVAESNINRQVQALGSTLGAAKVDAMRARIADIHPGCDVWPLDVFIDPGDEAALAAAAAHLTQLDVVVDACDDSRAKLWLAARALRDDAALVIVGAAGGKRQPQRVEVGPITDVTHDPLLARLRQRLRGEGLLPTASTVAQRPAVVSRGGVLCVFSRESIQDGASGTSGSLDCHGYGSSVMVTAAMGMAAAAAAFELGLSKPLLESR